MTDPERPWLTEYETYGIDETLEPYPDHAVHGFLETAAAEYPEQGLVQRGAKVTYDTVLEDVEQLATALSERGVGKGDRVATVLPTSVQFVVVTNAASRLGAVHIPNDFLESTDDLVDRLERGDPDVLVGDAAHRDLLTSLRDELGLDSVVLTDVDDYSADPPSHEPEPGIEWLPQVIEDAARDPPAVDIAPDDTHTLLFTGGTTGRPKGCLLTHRNLVANALQATAAQSRLPQLMRGNEAAVLALPMYHSYGYSTVNSLVELGLDLLLVPDSRDSAAMRELIAAHEPMIMLGVPTQYMELVDEELDHDVIGLSGSAPLASETREAFGERSGGVSQGYGLSEMSPVTHFHVAGLQEALLGRALDNGGYDQPTIGVPVPDTEIRLRDPESHDELSISAAVADGLEAEMLVNGPQRMAGYLDDPDPFDADGFVATGDVVKVDERGRFYVVDRVKNMINVSGLKVYTEAVDDVLFGMDGVRRPATVGVPDPERPGSERVKIFVEPEDCATVTPEAVRQYLDGRVPRQALPDEVEVLEEIPLTDIGKTDKVALRERHGAAPREED
jgi:long-chain acyl-CoA synthetase